VDFAFGTENAEAARALATAMDQRAQLLPIAGTLQTNFEDVSVEQNEVRGSVRVKDKKIDPWLAAVYARLSVDGAASGEDVARVR
jgi:hypothetical protein